MKLNILLIILILTLSTLSAHNFVLASNLSREVISATSTLKTPPQPQILTRKAITATITAYNVGIEAQNDSEPCIGATGEDLCEAIKTENICAANFLPFGTIIEIQGYGKCRIADRTAKKYGNRIDIAFQKDKLQSALNWGKKTKQIIY